MRNIFRSFLIISFIGTLALLHVHLKISLYQLSYRIAEKEQKLTEHQDRFEHLRLRIKQLRSPAHLEAKLEGMKLGFSFPQEIEVVRYHSEPVSLHERN